MIADLTFQQTMCVVFNKHKCTQTSDKHCLSYLMNDDYEPNEPMRTFEV